MATLLSDLSPLAQYRRRNDLLLSYPLARRRLCGATANSSYGSLSGHTKLHTRKSTTKLERINHTHNEIDLRNLPTSALEVLGSVSRQARPRRTMAKAASCRVAAGRHLTSSRQLKWPSLSLERDPFATVAAAATSGPCQIVRRLPAPFPACHSRQRAIAFLHFSLSCCEFTRDKKIH